MSEAMILALLSGLGTVAISVIGAVVTWKKTMADVEIARIAHNAELKLKEDELKLREKKLDDELKSREQDSQNEDDERDQKMSKMVGDTMRNLVTTLRSEIDLRDASLERERKQSAQRIDALTAQQLETNQRLTKTNEELAIANRQLAEQAQQIASLTEIVAEFSKGIDLLTEQITNRREEPVYKKKKSTGPLKLP